MTTKTQNADQKTALTQVERRALRTLRTRYREDHALFSNQELARLRFLRWRIQTERIEP